MHWTYCEIISSLLFMKCITSTYCYPFTGHEPSAQQLGRLLHLCFFLQSVATKSEKSILLSSIHIKPIVTVEREGSAAATWGDGDWRRKIQALGIRGGLKMEKSAAGEGRASLLLDLYLMSQWDEDEEEFWVGSLIEGITVAVIPQHETAHTERRRRRRREWSG